MTHRTSLFLLAGLAAACPLAMPVSAFEWRLDYGLHDFVVPQADSHTLGINATFYASHASASGLKTDFAFTAFLDNDKDKLDPDHLPLWWISQTRFEKEVRRLGEKTHLAVGMNLIGRRNTVSGVEKNFEIYPDLVLEHRGGASVSRFRLGTGYYYLEIDDDVPIPRGYTRGELGLDALAFLLAADSTFEITQSVSLQAKVEDWFDGDSWLHVRVGGEAVIKAFSTGSLSVGVEYTRYNLGRFQQAGNPLSVLPWNHDLLVRVAYRHAW